MVSQACQSQGVPYSLLLAIAATCNVLISCLLTHATRIIRCSGSTLFSWSTRCLSTGMDTRKSRSPPGTLAILLIREPGISDYLVCY